MREWIRSHLTYANVMATFAVFIALGGGTTAVALSGSNTVQSDDLGPGAQVKAADVAANAVNGSSVVNGSLALGDLNAASRPHKLEFSGPSGTSLAPFATVGNLQLSGSCLGTDPSLGIFVKNTTTQLGTLNRLLTEQFSSGGATALDTAGEFVGAGSSAALDRSDGSPVLAVAHGNFDRVEGQAVFQTPGRVTTITFHANTDVNGCAFFGTAVTSNMS